MNPEDKNRREELKKALESLFSDLHREMAKVMFLKENPHVQILENEKFELIVCLN